MLELDRVDIYLEVLMKSFYLELPRNGHLDQLHCMFFYLKKHRKPELVLNISNLIG